MEAGSEAAGSSWNRVGKDRKWILGGRKLEEAAGSRVEAAGSSWKRLGISWKRPEEVGSMVVIT